MVLHSTCELVYLEISNSMKICVPSSDDGAMKNTVNICNCSQ